MKNQKARKQPENSFYIDAWLAGVHIVNSSLLFMLFYQKESAKYNVFWEAIPNGCTNKRNRERVK
jgi:hypothetical protein